MEFNEKVDYIRSNIHNLKKSFKSDRDRHKRKALILKLSIACLAALATILLGWQSPSDSPLFQNIALIINASITVIATYEAFYKPKKLWVRETIVFSAFKDLERDFEYEMTEGIPSEDKLVEYKNRINSILNESLNEWVEDKKRGN